jgi:flavorubredoxin
MVKIDEIAAGVHRMSVFVPEFDLQFNHFLVKDEQPLLFHAGYRGMFPMLHEAVARILDPASIRWVAFSHFESDECGGLNRWLEVAPQAEPLCSQIGALVSVNDFADRPPRGLADGDQITTGSHTFRFCSTSHLPHGWDAGLLFDETTRTLLCSDLLHQSGNPESLVRSGVVERSKQTMREYQAGPLAGYLPYTPLTDRIIDRLAGLRPQTLAVMHGSSFEGDGEAVLREFGSALREVFGERAAGAR